MTLAGPELLEKSFVDGSSYKLLLKKDYKISSSPLKRLHSKKQLSYRKIFLTVFLLAGEIESVLSSKFL